MRGEPFSFDGDFGGPSDGGHFAEDPYYYGDVGHGVKRPFSIIVRFIGVLLKLCLSQLLFSYFYLLMRCGAGSG